MCIFIYPSQIWAQNVRIIHGKRQCLRFFVRSSGRAWRIQGCNPSVVQGKGLRGGSAEICSSLSGCGKESHPCSSETDGFSFFLPARRWPQLQRLSTVLCPSNAGAPWHSQQKTEGLCKTGATLLLHVTVTAPLLQFYWFEASPMPRPRSWSHEGETTWGLDCGVQHREGLWASQVGDWRDCGATNRDLGHSGERTQLRQKMLCTA